MEKQLARTLTTLRHTSRFLIFFNEIMSSVPRLPGVLQFSNTTENLKAKFFFGSVDVEVYPCEEAEAYVLRVQVPCISLASQVSSIRQIFNELDQRYSEMEHLTLEHRICNRSSERAQCDWPFRVAQLLRSFRNVKILRVDDGLVEDFGNSMLSWDIWKQEQKTISIRDRGPHDESYPPSLSTQLLWRDTFSLTIYELCCLL